MAAARAQTMAAAVVRGAGREARAVVDTMYAHPGAPAAGEVLVRVVAAGVNAPDVLQKRGAYPAPPGSSPLLGLEVAGEVVETGDAVDMPVGAHVCALTNGGGYAEYVRVPVEQTLLVPPFVTERPHGWQAAAAIPETACTAWHNVFERGGLRAGQVLLVHGGTGGVGSSAVAMAARAGAVVVTTVRGQDKVASALELGADLAIDFTTEDFVEVLRDRSVREQLAALAGARRDSGPHVDLPDGSSLADLGQGRVANTDGDVDVVLDIIGGDYIARNLSVLGTEGRHVSIAFQAGAVIPQLNLTRLLLKRLWLTGSTLRSRSAAAKAGIVANLEAWMDQSGLWTAVGGSAASDLWDESERMSSPATHPSADPTFPGAFWCSQRNIGGEPLSAWPLPGAVFRLSEAEAAHAWLRRPGTAGKCVLDVGSPPTPVGRA